MEQASTTRTTPDRADRSRRLRRLIYGVLLAVSIGGNVLAHDQLGQAVHRTEELAVFGALLGGFLVIWIVGLVVLALSVGRHAAHRLDLDALRQVRSIGLGSTSRAMLEPVVGSRGFRAGWAMSWIGTTGGEAIPGVAALLMLPPSTWGIVGFSALGVATNLLWRIPAQRQFIRIRAEARQAQGDVGESDSADVHRRRPQIRRAS